MKLHHAPILFAAGLLLAADAAAEYEPMQWIREYRVQGARTLPAAVVEAAVYPFLGRARSVADVEQARAALEAAYHEAGFKAVTVEVPPQSGAGGVVFLRVSEKPVGRLRVTGTRWNSPRALTDAAPELRESTVLDFTAVQRAVVRLNQRRELSVTPEVKPGHEPGTLDVDLRVEDRLPLHGSLEVNNRYNEGTTPVRLNAAVSYENLWQRGHGAGVAWQVAPERPADASVWSAWYLARFREIDWLTLLLQGTKQDSDVSTLGGLAAAGQGSVIGLRLVAALPGTERLQHSLSAGADWKRFDEDIVLAGQRTSLPIRYVSPVAGYSAAWTGKASRTELNLALGAGLRGSGSSTAAFDAKRFAATGSWLHLRGDAEHVRDLPRGFQAVLGVRGQLTGDSLVNNEQFSAGGPGTVRGYLESAALADRALLGSFEARSPDLLRGPAEWRLHAFIEGGRLRLNEPLPEQQDTFDLLGVGVGSTFRAGEAVSADIDFALPLRDAGPTTAGDWFLSFRLRSAF